MYRCNWACEPMPNVYDIAVIGTGNAGTTVAFECRKAGMTVAIIERGLVGGTCALRGCIPKKVLTGAAEAVSGARRLKDKGVKGEVAIEWRDLIRFKRFFTERTPVRRENSYLKAGIDTWHGEAKFTGPNTVSVGGEPISARHIVIATGAVPRVLGVPGEELVSPSDSFMGTTRIPERIVFIGGGLISFEFAHIAACAGARVTILHRGGRVLRQFDPDLVRILVTYSEGAGIDVRNNMPLHSVRRHSGGLSVRAGKGGETEVEADMVVHGAGRVSDIGGLDPDAGRIRSDEHGIVVNSFLQSVSNPAVYVVGDANASSGLQLTPVAVMEAEVVVANLLEGNKVAPDYSIVPTSLFTIPPLAAVGLTEEAVVNRKLPYLKKFGETPDWYTSERIGLTHSGYKVLLDPVTDRILGAHLLGYNADEVINLFALAMKAGIGFHALKKMVYSYPTASYDITRM